MTGSIMKIGDSYSIAIRVDTTDASARQLKRAGYRLRKDAAEALKQIGELIDLAGADDRLRRQIGDLIFAAHMASRCHRSRRSASG